MNKVHPITVVQVRWWRHLRLPPLHHPPPWLLLCIRLWVRRGCALSPRAIQQHGWRQRLPAVHQPPGVPVHQWVSQRHGRRLHVWAVQLGWQWRVCCVRRAPRVRVPRWCREQLGHAVCRGAVQHWWHHPVHALQPGVLLPRQLHVSHGCAVPYRAVQHSWLCQL
jgi:hypothetical protein